MLSGIATGYEEIFKELYEVENTFFKGLGVKFIKCKACGADIASNAKSCPGCGTKNKKTFYTK